MLSSVCGMEAGDYITWGGGVRAESSLSALRTDTSSCSQQSGMRLRSLPHGMGCALCVGERAQ